MTTEEDHNIDDLVDYKEDFDSGIESNSDSFNNDIMKLYEDHKKKGEKTSEIQNSQRPISKYQRNMVSAGKRDEVERVPSNERNSIGGNALINANINNVNSENNFGIQENNEIEVNMSSFIRRLSNFISKNQIEMSQVIDNSNIYYSEEDFREIFKKLRFELNNSEIEYLINYKNPSAKDGYILGQIFLNNFKEKFEWHDKNINMIEETQSENRHHLKIENLSAKKSDIDRINEEFKLLKDEVFQIVAKERVTRPKSTVKFKKNLLSANSNQNNPGKNPKKISRNDKNNENNNNVRPISKNKYTRQTSNISSVPKMKPQSAKSYLKETLQKKRAQEEMIRLAIERKNKENELDCIKKMTEANQLAEELGIPVSYSAYTDENEGIIICRIYDKNTKKTADIDLKRFLIEWKKLVKKIKQKELTKYYYKDSNEETKNNLTKESNTEKENILSYGREMRQNKIKEVLIDSLYLKMKLKKQLKALRDKMLVDPSIIKSNLKLVNLDDDNIL